MRYVLRRAALYLVAAWASITLNFLLPRLMPGDPAAALFARFRGKLRPEAMEALRQAFGAGNEPLWVQYTNYLGRLARGDLGRSVAFYPAPVGEVIGTGAIWTLALTGLAVVVAFAVGTSLGVVVAWRRNGRLDAVLPALLALLGAFPFFWLAMLVLYVFGFVIGGFPLRHAYCPDIEPGFTLRFAGDVLYHAALPALTIVLATAGGWVLGMRSTMVSVLGADFIKLARAKGLPPRMVMLRYAARNALLPNVTSFGMAIGFVLGGSLLTEIVFSYPGQGYLLVQAVRSQDYPLMQGLFLVITLSVLLANVLVDLVYVRLDPRARHAA